MSRESWGLRERRPGGGMGRSSNGRSGERVDRIRRWTNRFEVLDRTGEVDDSSENLERSTPVRRDLSPEGSRERGKQVTNRM
jgi:hypothetical protein